LAGERSERFRTLVDDALVDDFLDRDEPSDGAGRSPLDSWVI
jgi:hypothetical protein